VRVDREALARAVRRAQAEEALVFERERETELRRQVAELALEQDGDRVDAAAFAELDDEDVRRVRAALGILDEDGVDDDDPFVDDVFVELDFDVDADADEEPEDEGARLGHEIEESVRTQAALERFIAALDMPVATEAQ
jgi:hypothetical protein